MRFENSGDGDERVSGAFFIGRASFRMQIQEGGVVSAPMLGGHTPARGIGYAPKDLDALNADAEWDVGPVGDGDEAPAAEPPASIAPRRNRTRSIVAMAGVIGFVSGAMVAAVGLTIRRPQASLGRAAALSQPKAIEMRAPVPAPPPVIAAPQPTPEPPMGAAEASDAPAPTTTTATMADSPTTPVVSPAKPRHKPVKRAAKAGAPKGRPSWPGWVDPFAG